MPPARVLMIRPSALGDVSRTVPALVSLRAALPEARIDWLVNDAFADVIRHHPALDRALPFPRKLLGQAVTSVTAARAAWRWLRDMRHERYDLVLDLQGLARSGAITRLTGAARRAGFANARELAWLGYNRRHRVEAARHTVDRMLALIEAEGFAVRRDMRLYVGAEDQQWLARYRAEAGLGDGPYVVLAPTAKWLCKCWPMERYLDVARRVLASGRLGSRVVVLAAPSERAQVQPLLDALGAAAVCPMTRVGQMMAILSEARLLVCNDSAPLHIAVGLSRPIVTTFGPTDPALVGPYQRPETVVQPPGLVPADMLRYRHRRDDQSLIARIPLDAVWAKIEEQLACAPA